MLRRRGGLRSAGPAAARIQLLRGKDLETGHRQRRTTNCTVRDGWLSRKNDALDLTNWHEYLKCLSAAGYRSKLMISSGNAVLFSYALWIIGRIDFGLISILRAVIGRWFFMAHTTGRYTSSPESPGVGPQAYSRSTGRRFGRRSSRNWTGMSGELHRRLLGDHPAQQASTRLHRVLLHCPPISQR